jgi:hypothetical protein
MGLSLFYSVVKVLLTPSLGLLWNGAYTAIHEEPTDNDSYSAGSVKQRILALA